MDRTLTRRALALIDAHVPFVRATVVRSTGSVPGKVGASLLYTATGESFGTVGGAALEEKVKELAGETLRTHRGDLHHFELAAWKSGGLPSLCGGAVDIAFEYVPARPHLLLWGGGHVAHAIAALLPALEYDFSLADDRPEWASRDRFPTADRCEVVPAERLFEVFEPRRYTHLYVLGYDAFKDTEVLRRGLEAFPGYIGYIASAAKRAHILSELRQQGVPEERLAGLHSPIGVPIGAESPAEIAVSVIAEIIQGLHASAPGVTPGASDPPEGHVRNQTA